jgi:hypothetical protein
MPHQCWTIAELREELARFKQELAAAAMAEDTIHTYVDRSNRFVNWLAGEYEPGQGGRLVPGGDVRG